MIMLTEMFFGVTMSGIVLALSICEHITLRQVFCVHLTDKELFPTTAKNASPSQSST